MPGGLFALLFILYTTYRVLRQRTGTSWIQFLLAFGAIASFGASINLQSALILVVGGVLALAGVVFLLLEQRRSQTDLNQSQGVLTIGVSLLLMVSALVGPTIATTLTQITQESVATAQESAEPTMVEVIPTSAQARNGFATNTPAPTATPESVEVTLPDLLPTRYVYSTPAPAATIAALCRGLTQNNLNLRADPSAESELVLTIPHSTDLPIFGRNPDASWLYVGYQNQSGWVSAAYIIQNAECGNLPVQES